ncbi:methyltransferase [Conexibacter sp. CPCC 206217]|uniref:methyltransferase n=1 Tax=Conexibacter sp. CPCC 206217 TaxID=3064574 RepID=UPI00271CCC23|nr:methyltransferase [Conexibacter sp. CPCC 206217]MDO8211865.1 methyltransferase [Conexibacter sp. CPCC 206217]
MSGAAPADPLALLTAYQQSAVVAAAVTSGVADALASVEWRDGGAADGRAGAPARQVASASVAGAIGGSDAAGAAGLSVEQVAREAGTDPRATRILLSALVALGLARRADGLVAGAPVDAGTLFALTDAGAVLASDHPQTLAWIVRKEWFFYGVWNELPAAIEDGRGRISPWRERVETDRATAFGFLRALDDLAARFGGELAEAAAGLLPATRGDRADDVGAAGPAAAGSAAAGPAAAGTGDAGEHAPLRLLDVGGGAGSHAALLAGLRSDVRPTVLDLPQVAPVLAERHPGIPFVAGDLADERFGRSADERWDVVLLANILHDHTPAQNARLVREAARLLAPGGTLLLYEWIPDAGTTAPDLPLFAVMMMVENDGGDAYSEAEHRTWLEAAGLGEVELRRGHGPIAVVAARKPAGRTEERRSTAVEQQ